LSFTSKKFKYLHINIIVSGYIHMDLKMENVMVMGNPPVVLPHSGIGQLDLKLIDFGSAIEV
jgi:hypothetical protein